MNTRRHRRRATDHRRVVLESVATHPAIPFTSDIIADCQGPDYTPHMIESMIWQLGHEGLIEMRTDLGGYRITQLGLDWLTNGRFDQAIPKPHKRPGTRRRRRRSTDS